MMRLHAHPLEATIVAEGFKAAECDRDSSAIPV